MSHQYHIQTAQACCIATLKGSYLENFIDKDFLKGVESELEKGIKRVVVALAQLEYINSSGINTLVRLIHLVKKHDGRIAFAEVPAKINELLEIIQLNSMLTINNKIEDSIAYLTN